MSYRIVRITNLYNEYLRQYEAVFPHIIKEGSYREQCDHLIDDSFDTASSISKHLRRIGVQAYDIFTNVDWLQESWKKENNCNKSGRELILEQLKAFGPQVIWIDNPSSIDQKWIAYVRDTIRSVKIITGLVCAPYSSEDLRTLKAFDFIATCTPCLNTEFKKNGLKSFLIYHGFDEDILEKMGEQNTYADIDLLFTGSLYTGGGFHKTRIEYLEKFLKAKLPVKIYGSADSTSKVLSKMTAFYLINSLKKIGAGKMIPHIPLLKRYETFGDTPVRFYSKRLKTNLFQPVYGLEQFKLVSRAKVCFNIHGEIAKGCAGNLRLFEATGVGSCLVTDWKENLSDLFEPEKEVVTYKSKEECVDKIKWLLKNPSETEKIGKAGQARILKDHTITKRVELIDEILKSNM